MFVDSGLSCRPFNPYPPWILPACKASPAEPIWHFLVVQTCQVIALCVYHGLYPMRLPCLVYSRSSASYLGTRCSKRLKPKAWNCASFLHDAMNRCDLFAQSLYIVSLYHFRYEARCLSIQGSLAGCFTSILPEFYQLARVHLLSRSDIF